MKQTHWAKPNAAKDRYICVAYTGENGFFRNLNFEGTQTFDQIWRQAPTNSSHIVMQRGPNEWIVTDRFQAPLLADAHVAIGPITMFEDRNSAIMAAVMMAGNGSQGEFVMRLNAFSWSAHIGRHPKAARDAEILVRYRELRASCTQEVSQTV